MPAPPYCAIMPAPDRLLIHNGQVVTAEGLITPGYVAIENGVIAGFGSTSDIDDIEWEHQYDAQWNWVLPGLIDLHLQGGFGKSFFDADEGVVQTVSQNLPSHGVTGFLATTAFLHNDVTPIAHLRDAIAAYDQPGAEALGIHVEGPFLNAECRGGFSPEHIHEPDSSLFEEILEAAGDRLRMMTLAPEKVVEAGFIRKLIDRGIVAAMGHTAASAEIAGEAVILGMHYATHLYNAMAPFHHREPGPIGVALTRPEVVAELILDGVHVHPDAIKLAVACKGMTGIAACTDGTPLLGQTDGTYERWGHTLTVKDGTARKEDGTLVGTTKPLVKHLEYLSSVTGVPVEEAITAFSATPAKVLGLNDRKGLIQTGYDADIAVISAGFEPIATWCRGVQTFGTEA